MNSQVSLKCRCSDKILTALITVKRPLCGVRELVIFEAVDVSETLPALFATVRSLASVDRHVKPELFLAYEALSTLLARVRPFSSVEFDVPL